MQFSFGENPLAEPYNTILAFVCAFLMLFGLIRSAQDIGWWLGGRHRGKRFWIVKDDGPDWTQSESSRTPSSMCRGYAKVTPPRDDY